MKKRWMVLLMVVLCLGLVLSHTNESYAAKTVKLTFANWLPPHNPLSKGFEEWGKALEAKTGGKYKIDFQHGGVLAGIPQAYDVAVSGVAEISECITQDVEKPFPLTNIPSLPFNNATGADYTRAWHKHVVAKGMLDKEFGGVKLLFQYCGMGEDFLTMKPIRNIDDLKGVKISIGGGPTKAKLMKAVGAVGVFGGPPEIYMMLQKGIVDGSFISGLGLKEFHWDEFVRYNIEPLRVGTVVHSVVMNKKAYQKLSDEAKAAIDELNKDGQFSVKLASDFDAMYQAALNGFLNDMGETIHWTPAETARLDEITRPIWQEWISEQEAKGVSVKPVINAFYDGLKELGMNDPALGYSPAP